MKMESRAGVAPCLRGFARHLLNLSVYAIPNWRSNRANLIFLLQNFCCNLTIRSCAVGDAIVIESKNSILVRRFNCDGRDDQHRR